MKSFWRPFRILFGIIFLIVFGSLLNHFWTPFGVDFGYQIGSRRARMAPGEPSRAGKQRQGDFQKTFKNIMFFIVFGIRGLPRELQEAPEGSPEALEELQDLQKKRLRKSNFLR